MSSANMPSARYKFEYDNYGEYKKECFQLEREGWILNKSHIAELCDGFPPHWKYGSKYTSCIVRTTILLGVPHGKER